MRVDAQLTRCDWVTSIRRSAAENTEPFDIAIINLGSRGLDATEQIGFCRAAGIPRVIGFCGHLEVEIRRAAKAAEIDKILTNENALSDLLNHL